MPPKGKFMDVLDVLSSSDSESAGSLPDKRGPPAKQETAGGCAAAPASADALSDANDSEEEDATTASVARKRKAEVTLEDLQRAGYRSGPSVLLVRPQAEEGQQTWEWSSGKEAKAIEPVQESLEDRLRTEEAVTVAVQESAEFSMRAVQQAELLRRQAHEEKARLAAEKRLSFQQKEKRKRDAGQASRAKNFVEEEKRMGRQFNMYSGFD